MSLHQTTLEDAYGGKPFGTRAPIRDAAAEAPKPIEPKGEERAQSVARSLLASLPLDTAPPVQEGFKLRVEEPALVRERVRERFTERPTTGADEDKISRILRLIEQNRTGYERPAVQDMILYVFTGVFFLFTFDTFVMMGKGMRKVQRT
jgi:hypothetical protein